MDTLWGAEHICVAALLVQYSWSTWRRTYVVFVHVCASDGRWSPFLYTKGQYYPKVHTPKEPNKIGSEMGQVLWAQQWVDTKTVPEENNGQSGWLINADLSHEGCKISWSKVVGKDVGQCFVSRHCVHLSIWPCFIKTLHRNTHHHTAVLVCHRETSLCFLSGLTWSVSLGEKWHSLKEIGNTFAWMGAEFLCCGKLEIEIDPN